MKLKIIIPISFLIVIPLILLVTRTDYSSFKKIEVAFPNEKALKDGLVPALVESYMEYAPIETTYISGDYLNKLSTGELANFDLFYVVNSKAIKSLDVFKTLYKHDSKSSYLRELNSGFKSLYSDEENLLYIPVTYSPWGIYYNKDRFKELGVGEPKTMGDLYYIVETINKKGVSPFVITTRDGWIFSIWFDYINLRLHGYEFHKELLEGKVPFTHKKVLESFKYLYKLIKSNWFVIDNSGDWKVINNTIEDGDSVMVLGSSFIYDSFKNRDQIGWFEFPDLNYNSVNIASSSGFIVNKESDNIQEIEFFIKKSLSSDVQFDIYKTKFNPVTKKTVKYSKQEDLIESLHSYRDDRLLTTLERGMDSNIKNSFKNGLIRLFFLKSEAEINNILDHLEDNRLKNIIKN